AQDKPSFIDAIRDTPATVVEAIICFFSIWSIVGLWGYHTYLICRSVTTNEDIKNTWNISRPGVTMKNPYSKGNPCVNCFSTICGPRNFFVVSLISKKHSLHFCIFKRDKKKPLMIFC
ncbi:unnamed protein product, partial [Rotaria sp. Silwood2]